MAENENTGIMPEHNLTDDEIAAQDQARAAAETTRLAPFRALRRRMDAGLRYAVANDGVTDICATYKPRRTETIDTRDGTFTTAMLSRGCRKVLSVKRDGREEDFYDGDASEVIVTSGGPGKIEVTYRSVPREMFASTDEPDIPAYMHGLLVSYVVGRERAAGDVSQQRGGNIYFQMYEAGKAAIRPHLGGGTSQRIVNRW